MQNFLMLFFITFLIFNKYIDTNFIIHTILVYLL